MAGYGDQTDGVPLGRPAQPEEIAPAFLFFASIESCRTHHASPAETLIGVDL
ncbi:hypothetical protein [Micromonospora purpureochromogenes]|uniref:hypothetical protein n=1 Tax=Micromonospora purpureochromogenes TaxID=47872 RepID=UPI0018D549F0|nr:hypothetical protein [Micromonospora purpureochromogenes]